MKEEIKRPKKAWFKVAGMTAAAILIVFGSFGNMVRTVRFGLRKLLG